MKIFLPLSIFTLLIFYSFSIPDEEIPKTNSDADFAVTTMARICDFRAFFYPGGVGPCDAAALALDIDNNCMGVGEGNVLAVNLTTGIPQLHEVYSLPDDMPDLYYEYTTVQDGTTTIGPVDEFVFEGEYHTLYNGTLMPIFEFSTPIYIDVFDECGVLNTPNIIVEVRLVDETGHLYPANDYSEVDQAFYCGVFSETCGTCSAPPPTCGNGFPPEYLTVACGECEGCGKDQIDKFLVNEPEKAELFSSKAKDSVEPELSELNVQPNPFTSEIQVTYTVKEQSNIHVDVLDAKGSVLVQKNFIQQEGEISLNLDLNELVEGIYFCRVQVDQEVFIRKIIKL